MGVYTGTTGSDTLYGSEAADTINGLAGSDKLYGLGGNDFLVPGNEQGVADTVDGGAGSDTVSYIGATGVSVNLGGLFPGSSTVSDLLLNVENVLGSAGQDTMTGSSAANELFGFGSDDKLMGEAGNDRLSGGEGKDLIVGGVGADTLWGGAAADKFRYTDLSESTGAAHDSIEDFSHAQKDRIDLKGIDANDAKGGDQEFGFIGDDGFTKAGQAHVLHTGGNTVVQLNTDADIQAEAEIWLKGEIDLAKGDFVL